MDRRELFALLILKKEIDFDHINTNCIFTGDHGEFQFKEKLSKEIDEWQTTSVEGSSNLCIYVHKKGVIFVAGCGTWQTHPEGPNNEPPGMDFSTHICWFTKKSPVIKPKKENIRIITNWEELKKEAFESLEDYQKFD